ncbi:MAG: thiamine pyrophosphate-dependent enzyme [Thermoanaerobacteraceae bacterium]|nr:thiamine pyrophosphate-dependent enzyme [Thermoanaerobacteraceae bacterium]
MATLRDIAKKPELLSGGHRLCAGCGAPVTVRRVLSAVPEDTHVVVANATGCLEVSTTVYPYSAWRTSYIHSAFENAGATISGVEAAYKVLKRRGKINEKFKFIAFGGDGGTYDIGLQSLSGALERGHDFVYVCYDNGAYMNTGIQRSSATPLYADTTTSPAGDVIPGKSQLRKELADIAVAHNIPYVAQSTPAHWKDLYEKAEKAINVDGPAVLNVLAICPRGWRTETAEDMEITRLAVDTCVWPMFEVVEGKWKLTYKPRKKLPVEEYLKKQGRFKHMFQPGNEHLIEEFQKQVDKRWEEILARCGEI